MQKIWFRLFGLIVTTGAIAADLCVKNDAMVVALNPHNSQTVSSTYDEGDAGGIKTWTVTFPYGTISGIAANYNGCSAEACIPDAAAQANISAYSTGPYCYCKMLRPAESQWVRRVHNSHIECSDNWAYTCAHCCAMSIKSQINMRRALFQSVNMIE